MIYTVLASSAVLHIASARVARTIYEWPEDELPQHRAIQALTARHWGIFTLSPTTAQHLLALAAVGLSFGLLVQMANVMTPGSGLVAKPIATMPELKPWAYIWTAGFCAECICITVWTETWSPGSQSLNLRVFEFGALMVSYSSGAIIYRINRTRLGIATILASSTIFLWERT